MGHATRNVDAGELRAGSARGGCDNDAASEAEAEGDAKALSRQVGRLTAEISRLEAKVYTQQRKIDELEEELAESLEELIRLAKESL
jgi:peptidoglycan hydrolase CwlO-like protein